jgi:hypothetical protein
MRRLNVRPAQIDECIEKSMFALSVRPQNPELRPGELLLLQLVKTESIRRHKQRSRIDFALVFSQLEPDYDGTISRAHWPHEGRIWPWIVYGTATVPTIPFSLEALDLSRSYDGQDNARYIDPRDEAKILPFIQGELARKPNPDLQAVPLPQLVDRFGQNGLLDAIRNHDHIAEVGRKAEIRESRILYDRNASLADGLKHLYLHRCQVCGNDFEPTYGAKYAESHHIQYLSQGGPDISPNIMVLCPNHHRIIHETNAQFNRASLQYEYPNGLQEKLLLPTHFLLSPTTPS